MLVSVLQQIVFLEESLPGKDFRMDAADGAAFGQEPGGCVSRTLPR